MHDKPMSESEGEFRDGWKPTKPEAPNYRCRRCGSGDVWDSDCGGFEDVKYECRACKRVWWCESADA